MKAPANASSRKKMVQFRMNTKKIEKGAFYDTNMISYILWALMAQEIVTSKTSIIMMMLHIQ